jgi:hypothetical protein
MTGIVTCVTAALLCGTCPHHYQLSRQTLQMVLSSTTMGLLLHNNGRAFASVHLTLVYLMLQVWLSHACPSSMMNASHMSTLQR